MPLKNYESDSSIPNIFAAIEKSLLTHGAKQIMKDYDGTGKVTAISFLIGTSSGEMFVRLPALFDRVKEIFDDQGLRYKPDQPYRTAWATLRDRISVDLAMVDLGMRKVEQAFIADAVGRNGKTFFEMAVQSGFYLNSGEESK